VTNKNLLKCLLRIPLKEIEAFIEQASRNSQVRETVIPPIQAQFLKSTAVSKFVENWLEAKKKVE
jgi:hypothetical protein